jgi:hypothetical protein
MLIALSANVCNTARLRERLGETEATHAIERCLRRMERSIAGHGGQLLAATDGELLATFTAAELACQAAIDMQNRVATLPPVSGIKLPIRIGLHGIVKSLPSQSIGATALVVATRIAARAAGDQILASAALLEELPRQTSIGSGQRLEIAPIEQDGGSLQLVAIEWRSHDAPLADRQPPASAEQPASLGGRMLSVRYQEQTMVIDARSPRLTIGRDPTCGLVIGDRKVSRAHGQIERRHDGYFYLDSSSNGSHVRLAGQAEIRLRHQEIELSGSGRIFFGGPAADTQTEFADFTVS